MAGQGPRGVELRDTAGAALARTADHAMGEARDVVSMPGGERE